MRRLTQQDIINRIKRVHGDRYDLSKLSYVNRRTKVEIICKKHGSWETTTGQLFRGQGCPECGLISQGEKRRLPQNEFLIKCIEVHGDRYDYLKVDYQGMINKLIITCKEHGDFEQTPSSHLNGSGCPKCGLISQMDKRRLPIEDFISRSIKTHGDRYDYLKVHYVNSSTEVEIICSIHGGFHQQPQFHMNGSGCPKCSIIEQHEKQKKSKEDFIIDSIKVHGDLYDYSKVDLIDTKSEVIIICKKHGEFLQTPNNHQRGNGCPNCNSSKGELFISQYLKEKGVNYKTQRTFEGMRDDALLRCDFYIESINTVLEFNGRQHYEPVKAFGGKKAFKETQKLDRIKKQYCINNNINFEVIRYDEIVEERMDEILEKYS